MRRVPLALAYEHLSAFIWRTSRALASSPAGKSVLEMEISSRLSRLFLAADGEAREAAAAIEV
jgi:hypothetical protein